MTDSWQADGPADDEMSDRWRAVVSDTHLPWSTHVAPGPAFAASVRRWWIDDLALVDVECAPTSGSRGRSQIAATDGEFVALLFIRAGHEVIRTNGDTVRLAPGDAVVWDSTRTARFDVPGRLSKRSLLIPRAALAEVSGGAWATPGAVLERGRPAIALLTGYLDTLAGILPGLDPAAVVAAPACRGSTRTGRTAATGSARAAARDPAGRRGAHPRCHAGRERAELAHLHRGPAEVAGAGQQPGCPQGVGQRNPVFRQ